MRGGNFGQLLHAVAKDPAMVIYLDSASNRKGKPNENFAREVMELFTLGEGRYTEADVREAARAFTGWSIDPDSGDFRSRPALHDEGTKTVLGKHRQLRRRRGARHPALAPRDAPSSSSTKLWREFVSPEPDAAEVRRMAAEVPSLQLRGQGRAAGTAPLAGVLGPRRTAAR